VKVSGDWKYLYRAVDKAGQTVDFLLRAHRLGGDNDYVRPSDIHLGRW